MQIYILVVGTLLSTSGCTASRLSPEQLLDLQRRSATRIKMAVSGDEDPQVRASAIYNMRQVDLQEVRPWMLQGLFDPDPQVRATSILTLLLHDDASALEAVRRLRDDHSKVVRAAVILFQLHAGEKVQTAPLLDLLYAPGQLPADPLLQELITEAGQYLTEAQLRDRLQAHSGLQPQWDTAAGIALLNKNDPQQLRAVLAQASNAAGSRQLEAIRALAHARDPQVVYVLEEQVKDCPSLEGRLAAAYALSRFGSTKGVSPALDYLSDEARHAEESTAGTRLTQLAYATCAAAGDKQVLRQLGEWFDLESPGLARIACAGAVLELCARLGP